MKVPSEEELAFPDPTNEELVAALRAIPTWTEPYLTYLTRGDLPGEEVLNRRIVRRAKSYTVINGELYERSTTGIFLRCVSPEEGQQILKEIHEGDCGHHASTRSLAAKAFRHGFFWLTALADAERLGAVAMDVRDTPGKPTCRRRN